MLKLNLILFIAKIGRINIMHELSIVMGIVNIAKEEVRGFVVTAN